MLNPDAFSLRWYQDLFESEQWLRAIQNSIFIGVFATLIATALGTVAALGLSKSNMPGRTTIMVILLSPMIVPVIITAAGMYFFFYQHRTSARRISGLFWRMRYLEHHLSSLPSQQLCLDSTAR